MSCISKGFPLLPVVILAVSSLIMVEFAFAQSISKPSVPEFTLKIVARPYDVSPTATIDPYTGQNIVTHGDYHAENKSIDVTIKNQPSDTYYQIQFKGHYNNDWQLYSTSNMITPIQLTQYIAQSNSDYTVVSVPLNSDQALNSNGKHVGSITNFPEGGQVDFQVRALVGSPTVYQAGLMGDMVRFDGVTGDWSNIQTITIPEGSTSTSSPNPTPTSTQNPTPTPTVPELSLLAILSLFVSMLSIAVILRHRKPDSLSK